MVDAIALVASTGVIFALYAIGGLSLNLEYGYAGIPNFGKAAFQAVGAFVAGVFVAYTIFFITGSGIDVFSAQTLQQRMEFGRSNPLPLVILFVVAIALASISSGVFGYLVARPVLRLTEDYLALVFLIFSEMLRLVARGYYPLVGGTQGLGGIPGPFIWAGTLSPFLYSVMVLTIALLVFLFAQKLVNSPYGRLLRAIRDSELATQVLGKDSGKIKGKVIFIGSAIAGLGGALYAFYTNFVIADDFAPQRTFELWLIVILGGSGNNKGVLLAAFFVAVLDRVTIFLSGLTVLPFEVNYLRYAAVGFIILAILFYAPSGMIKEEPVKTPAISVLQSERST